ncbi:MAG: 2-hydroxyacid dehydrogenase [Syntrophobacteraceae bacterium]
MPEILISHNFEQAHREILKEILSGPAQIKFLSDIAKEDRASVIERADIVISWNPAKEFSAEELKLLGRVRLIQLVTAGAEHLPFPLLPSSAIIASNPSAFAEPMAEHILAMVFALAKRLCVNHAKLKQGEFDQKTKNRNLRGHVFGVLGFGGIGQAAARVMRSVGLRIFAINTSGRTTEKVDFISTLDDLDHLLNKSDVLLVSIPLTLRTKGLIGSRELALMKHDAILINVARGHVIDEQALYRHLAQNPGFSAGIDTWWIEPSKDGEFKVNYPFFNLPNFLGSPHNSSITPGTMANAARLAAQNAADFLSSGKIRGEIRKEDYVEE